jgi:ADP-ribosyl-[dinitrogen reductase] hydrolase
MLGAILGDIAGSFREFSKDKFKHLPLFPKKEDVPFRQREKYGFTDDTVTTMATMKACQETLPKGVEPSPEDFKRAYHDLCNEYPNTYYGKNFAEWLKRDYAHARPYDSCGNGSAMRVSPIGWWATSEEQCARMARNSAIVSHNHPEGIKGAVFVALMVYLYRNKDANPEKSIQERHGISYGRSKGYDHFDLICQETIPLALHFLDTSESYVEAVHKAVTVPNGDSDTLGAIVGAIAEARWGLPKEVIKVTIPLLPEQIKPLAKKVIGA